MNLNVGDIIRVNWSNGHGYSDYRIEETLDGPHTLVLIKDAPWPTTISYCPNCHNAMLSDEVACLHCGRKRS